ncbi:MAG: hypothetical protein GY946_05440 [bacterium]|nr:hypothetical protein [bacterium]
MKKVCAHTFACDLDLMELRTKLEALGPYDWQARDSFYFGAYLSARVMPDASRKVKIYERDQGGYQIDIFFEGDAESDWVAFVEDIHERLLPGVGAADVEETETMN